MNFDQITNDVHEFLWKIKVGYKEILRCAKFRKILKRNIEFKNCHKGKRCFVIGNGPSLTVDDLDKLHKNNEITFASNKIFQLFDDTDWRPTYFSTCDTNLFNNNKEKLLHLDTIKFFPLDIIENTELIDSTYAYSRFPFQIFKNKPTFTPDLIGHLSEGGTVTFFLMQIAVYMGIREIYLIGCDFNFSYGIDINGNYFENKNVKNHFKEDGKKLDTMPNLQLNRNAYLAAKKYADKKGIKIINATRGGKLEVFERKPFDELFSGDIDE